MNLKNRHICIELLEKSSSSPLFINDIISDYFENEKIIHKDRKYITNMILGSIRMKGQYDYILSKVYNGDYRKLKFKLKNILRLACYQIDKMDSIPTHAAVSTSVEITKKVLNGYQNLVNALLRQYIKIKDKFPFDHKDGDKFPMTSHPSWLVNKWIKDLGLKKTFKLCKYNNIPPYIWFRINHLEEIELIKEKIREIGLTVEFHEISNSFFKTSSNIDLINSFLFKDGRITIQNPLNAIIVNLLDPKDNELIIDGCSAPGGKGSLISLIAPKSKIFSIDLNKKRMAKLEKTIKRHRIDNIETMILDMSTDSMPKANKILLDVPCSGTGVINRRVDLRWKRSFEDLKSNSQIQYDILKHSSKFLLDKGVIVYSTCSIEKEENFDVINKFLSINKDFKIDSAEKFTDTRLVKNKAINVLPGSNNLDGGFAIRLKKI